MALRQPYRLLNKYPVSLWDISGLMFSNS